MALVSLREWENTISSHVNGAPVPAMMDAVRDAVILFCRESRIIREHVPSVNVEALRPDTDVPDSSDGLYPSAVLRCYNKYGLIDRKDYLDLDNDYPKGYFTESVATMSLVRGWISRRPATVYLVPRLSVDIPGGLHMEVAFQPKRNALEVPQFLYEMFSHEIGAGAIALLHGHEQAPYANPSMIAPFAGIFADAVKKAAEYHDEGFGQARRRTRTERQ